MSTPETAESTQEQDRELKHSTLSVSLSVVYACIYLLLNYFFVAVPNIPGITAFLSWSFFLPAISIALTFYLTRQSFQKKSTWISFSSGFSLIYLACAFSSFYLITWIWSAI